MKGSIVDWLQGITGVEDERAQGGIAWKAWRAKGLGSSDAATLLGWSPWKTLQALLEEKLGLLTPEFNEHQKSAMQRGKDLEPEIRRWYEDRVQAKFTEDTAEHPGYSFMRASFDGINHELKKLIEIKAPKKADHEIAAQGMVPKKYIPQCQWLMLVACYDHLDYVSYGSDGTYHVVPVVSDATIQSELTYRAMLFWQSVTKKEKTPPAFPSPWKIPLDPNKRTEMDQSALDLLVLEAIDAKEAFSKASTRYEALKSRIKDFLDRSDQSKVCAREMRFGYCYRRGAIAYDQIPELKSVNLGAYRKPATKIFYFERDDEND